MKIELDDGQVEVLLDALVIMKIKMEDCIKRDEKAIERRVRMEEPPGDWEECLARDRAQLEQAQALTLFLIGERRRAKKVIELNEKLQAMMGKEV